MAETINALEIVNDKGQKMANSANRIIIMFSYLILYCDQQM